MDIKNWKENIEDLFYKTVPNGNKFSNLSKTDIERLKPKITDFIDQLLQESMREEEEELEQLKRFIMMYVKQEKEIRLHETSTLSLDHELGYEMWNDPKTGDFVIRYSPQEDNAEKSTT